MCCSLSPAIRSLTSILLVSISYLRFLPSPQPHPTLRYTAFMTPTWRNTAIATTLAIIIYTTSTASALPLFSRVLAQITPDAKTWTERNERHLELTRGAAEDRLLFQEAERPRIHRLRNPA